MKQSYPQRIVCLTEETTETLYLLQEEWRIVGISGFTVRPPHARKEKPKVSAFTSAKVDKILQLQPDLVLGFSDIQADIAATLVRAGVNVHIFNQRSVQEIFSMLLTLGGMIGCQQKAEALHDELAAGIDDMRHKASKLPKKPKVYFEEWDDPLICGIQWVSELIEIAGGENVFADLAQSSLAKGRIIEDPKKIIARAPDIILGSWCGKKFRPQKVAARAGWSEIPAVKNKELHEIKSAIILQPGPAALTDGVSAMHEIFSKWAGLGNE